MKSLKHTALLLMLATAAAASAEDSIPDGGKLEIVKTSPEVATILKRTRPVENKAIPVPKFVVKSANNDFLLTIGGMINPGQCKYPVEVLKTY